MTRMLLCATGLLLFSSASSEALAQTALLDVKAGTTPLFKVNDDAGLVGMGAFATGVIPAAGAGVRLMWYPAKAAFRAGHVLSTQWDEANVGAYSVAMGYSTVASGLASTATGFSTSAIGDYSVAMGRNAFASGLYATALGYNNQASGDHAAAIGPGAFATGDYATAIGNDTEASGNYALAMGYDTEASGNYATAMGRFTTAQAYGSLVLGRYNVLAGDAAAWVSTDPVLVVGNGFSTTFRDNAFTLLKNGNLTIAGTLTENSDRRLKRDLQPLSDVVSALGRLQPVRYRFREGTNRPEGEHIGLVAQEVEAEFPELVQAGADGYLSVSYTKFVAVLVQALNEQQAELEAQRTEQEAQRDQIEALTERLARLEVLLLNIQAETASPDEP